MRITPAISQRKKRKKVKKKKEQKLAPKLMSLLKMFQQNQIKL